MGSRVIRGMRLEGSTLPSCHMAREAIKPTVLRLQFQMATEEREVVLSSSILAQFANSEVDWLSIPPEQGVIDDETLEWLVVDVLPTDDGSDHY